MKYFKKKLSLIRYLICTNINLKTLLKKYKNKCQELYNENLTNELHYNKQKKVIIKEYSEIRNENKQLINEVYELQQKLKMVELIHKINHKECNDYNNNFIEVAIHKDGKYNV